jgi:hypothetical protein
VCSWIIHPLWEDARVLLDATRRNRNSAGSVTERSALPRQGPNHDLRAKRLLTAQSSIGDLQRMSSSVALRLAAIVASDQSSQVRVALLPAFTGRLASSCLIKLCFFVSV